MNSQGNEHSEKYLKTRALEQEYLSQVRAIHEKANGKWTDECAKEYLELLILYGYYVVKE